MVDNVVVLGEVEEEFVVVVVVDYLGVVLYCVVVMFVEVYVGYYCYVCVVDGVVVEYGFVEFGYVGCFGEVVFDGGVFGCFGVGYWFVWQGLVVFVVVDGDFGCWCQFDEMGFGLLGQLGQQFVLGVQVVQFGVELGVVVGGLMQIGGEFFVVCQVFEDVVGYDVIGVGQVYGIFFGCCVVRVQVGCLGVWFLGLGVWCVCCF